MLIFTTTFRFAKFQEMAAKGIIDPRKLPPTERAAIYHSMRTHFQILIWETLIDDGFNPLD